MGNQQKLHFYLQAEQKYNFSNNPKKEKPFEEELRRHSRNGIIMDNLMLSTQN